MDRIVRLGIVPVVASLVSMDAKDRNSSSNYNNNVVGKNDGDAAGNNHSLQEVRVQVASFVEHVTNSNQSIIKMFTSCNAIQLLGTLGSAFWGLSHPSSNEWEPFTFTNSLIYGTPPPTIPFINSTGSLMKTSPEVTVSQLEVAWKALQCMNKVMLSRGMCMQ